MGFQRNYIRVARNYRKNITVSSTRKNRSDRLRPSQTMSKLQEKTLRDRLRPSQTMSKLQQEPSNSMCIHTVQVQFLFCSHRNTVSADFKIVPG